MQLNIKVTAEGQTHDITTGYADVIALENKFDIDASVLTERMRAGWIAYLAWHALKRQNKTQLTFEAWTEQLEDLNPEDESGNA